MRAPHPSCRALARRRLPAGGFALRPVLGVLATPATLAALALPLAGDGGRRRAATRYRIPAQPVQMKVKAVVDGWKARFHAHPPTRLRTPIPGREER